MMMLVRVRSLAPVVVALAALVASAAAGAATVAIQPGGTLAPSYVTSSAGTSGVGDVYLPVVPGSYNYSYGFSPNVGVLPAAGPGTAGFYVEYLFTVDSASANTLTSTIDLGTLLQISGLQARLYSYDLNPSIPLTGVPAGSAFVGWSAPATSGGSGTLTVIDGALLTPGTWVLQIRGTATGTAGGSFGGVLNLSQVPLPAAGWLLISGLAGLGFTLRRRGLPPRIAPASIAH